ncbi:energy transducer TonB [Acetobacter cibinongensis]|uniref:energy transducer TonB n=1 Tax=Acetobacter cibinongensis TaxID=146475 RepID=UPI001F0A2580|nr:energy transducer TonB [Acetobacter cibinongensis]
MQQAHREEAKRWGLSLLTVLLVGSGAAWWIIHLPAPAITVAEPPPAAIAIDMAPEPIAAPTPTTNVPLGPQQTLSIQDPAPVEPPKLTAPPAPAPNPPIPVSKPEKPRKITKKHKPVMSIKKTLAEDTPPAETTTAPPSSDAPPAPDQAAPASGAPSAKTTQERVTWQGALLAQLERFKRYPPEAMAEHKEGVPSIKFSMDRKGHVLSVTLIKSTGSPLLDAEALALPKRAQPLPSPPDTVPGNIITLTVPIEFYINSQND